MKNVRYVALPPPKFDPCAEFPHGTCPICKQPGMLLHEDGTLTRHNVPGLWDEVPTRAGPDQETIDLARALGARSIRVPTKCEGGERRMRPLLS